MEVKIVVQTNKTQVPDFYLKEVFPQDNTLVDNRKRGSVSITLLPRN